MNSPRNQTNRADNSSVPAKPPVLKENNGVPEGASEIERRYPITQRRAPERYIEQYS